MSEVKPCRVALIGWGDHFEDFLDSLGVTLDEFRAAFRGSWQLAYIEALRGAGIETVFFQFSCRIDEPQRFIHEPTGSPWWLLPVPRAYRMLKPFLDWLQPIARKLGLSRIHRALENIADYLATPLLRLRRCLRIEGSTVLLVQGFDFARFDLSVLLGHLLGLPVYATYQGGTSPSGNLRLLLRNMALKRSAGFIVAPDSDVARLQLIHRVDPERVARIFNPIETEFWRPMEKISARERFGFRRGSFIVAWHGRVDVGQKGLDILIDAWRILLESRRSGDLLLVLLGTGPDASVLRSLVERPGIAQVLWLDRFSNDREEIRAFLSSADIYVFPSRREGFAVSPLEAMACGVPVIASRTATGMEDVFPEAARYGGNVIDHADPERLAAAIGDLIDDEELRKRMGPSARARAVEQASFQTAGRQLSLLFRGAREGYRRGRTANSVAPILLQISPGGCRSGERFNVQPEGQSAVVARALGATPSTFVMFDDQVLLSTFGGAGLLTALVPHRLLRKPRSYSVRLTDGIQFSNCLMFEVRSPTADSGAAVLVRIHPDRIATGEPFNPQPDGSSALAVECQGAAARTRVVFNGSPLVTAFGDRGFLTASLSPELYRLPGRYSVRLVDDRGESNPLELIVEAPDEERR